MTDIHKEIQRDEGFRGAPYSDSVGVTTIGFGRNLEANPITQVEWYEIGQLRDLNKNPLSRAEAEVLYRNDYYHAFVAAHKAVGRRGLAEDKMEVLVNMAFNLGDSGLRGFKGMIKALLADPPDFKLAAEEMKWKKPADKSAGHTKWWTQVGARAERLYNKMKG